MRERVLRLGPEGRLVGIMTEPATRARELPVFLMLNAGVVHRVGPNRVYVGVARRLAAMGFASCRFDVSGLGDSMTRRDGLPYEDARIADTREAMDHLQRALGGDRFVTLGLCSGADHAFRVALADDRVVGSVLLDGYTYPTARHDAERRRDRLGEIRRRLLDLAAWKRLVTGRHPIWGMIRARVLRRKDLRMQFMMDTPPRDEAESGIRRLVDRGAHLFFVYTSRQAAHHQSTVRAGEPFPPADPSGAVRVTCLPDSDHEFTLLTYRERLLDAVGDWAETVWPQAVLQDRS
jgi:hypothetical protein